MPSNKPTSLPYWTQGLAGQVAQPPTSLRDAGFTAGQPPAAEHVNQLFYELGQYIAYLDQAQGSSVLSATLDASVRLVGGGTLSYAASTQALAWSLPLVLSVPSIADADNTLAAGAAIVPNGCVLSVQANVPFSTTADLTQGATAAINLAYALPVTQGQTVTGPGIPQGTTVQRISGATVTLSHAATQTATQSTLTFRGTGPLQAQVTAIDKLVPNSNTIIIARGLGSAILVGVNAAVTVLHDNESKTLLEPGYQGIVRAPAGQALTALQAVYLSADTSGARTQGAVYPTDASSALGQARSNCLGFVYTPTPSGQTAAVMTGGILPGFVALTPGASYWLDPATPGGITSTQPTFAQTPYGVRVGQALTPTMLLVRPEHVPDGLVPSVQATTANITTLTAATASVTGPATFSGATFSGTASAANVVSAAGFKTQMYAGCLSNVSVSTGSNLIGPNGLAALVPVPAAGSVVCVAIVGQTNSNIVNVDLYRGNTLLWTTATVAISGPGQYANNQLVAFGYAAKGQYPVAKGDNLRLVARGSTPFGPDTATNVYLQGYITLELAA